LAVTPHYIADKSAFARLRYPQVSAFLSPLILAGEVATCSVIELEVLYSARSLDDMRRTRATRTVAFPLIEIVQSDFDRAIDVMELLALRGHHRAVGIPDLIISAVAEREHLTLVHYDADFDFVAEITGQPMQWVVPRGSVP
jgi:predicted nucleic acid-binding protein